MYLFMLYVDYGALSVSVPDSIWAEWWTIGLLMCCSMTCINLQNNLLSISDRWLWMSCSLSINQLCSSCIFLYHSKKEELTLKMLSIAVSVISKCAVQDVRESLFAWSNEMDSPDCLSPFILFSEKRLSHCLSLRIAKSRNRS